MDSACILAVFSARTFSFETFWAKAGDTSSALTRNPVDRLTTLFKMNQLEGLPLPSNVSPGEQPPKKGLFVSDQQARLKLQQHSNSNVGQARGDQTQTDSATEHGQQLTLDSETQRGSESDDENAFPRYLRPHLGPVHQRFWLRCFGRLAAHALRSAMTHGPSTPSE